MTNPNSLTYIFQKTNNGLVDTKLLAIKDYPEVWNCLNAPPTREPCNISFFVKDECKANFSEIWRWHFKDLFILITGDEAFLQSDEKPRERGFSLSLDPKVGFEATTLRLTVACSIIR